MGKFDFNMDDSLVKQLLRLQNVDEIAPQILEEAVPVLEENVKAECRKHKRTGEMEKSVKKTKCKRVKDGYVVVVRPTGQSKLYKTVKSGTKVRKEKVRNMEIMAHLEYGTKHQKPEPILSKAVKDSETESNRRMQEAFDRLAGGNK